MDATQRERYVEAATRNVGRTGAGWWLVATVLAAIVGFGLYAYVVQVREGHAVTGVSHTVFWGIYIANFVFFIGISYGGAIVSAILRLTNAKWRAPIARLAEGTAVVTLGVGAASVLVDVGRPDRMLYLLVYAQPGSPITWDWIAINTYLVGTLIFFFLPLIPDLARRKDDEAASHGLLARMHRFLSFGWHGAPQQERSLLRAMTIMSILIIPLAVTVHSVLAWLFAVTVQTGWHSTIFAPLFVLGAMLSGVATVILVLAVARRVYDLGEFITTKHFQYLGYLLIAFDAAYLYFMISEYLTDGYVQEEPLGLVLRALLVGPYATWFWTFVGGGLVIPLALVALPGPWRIARTAVASALVVAGMWLKRYLIVILPGVLLPIPPEQVYQPTWVEMAITTGAIAAIPLGLMVLFALFPVMSVHEMEEVEGAVREHEAARRVVAPSRPTRTAPAPAPRPPFLRRYAGIFAAGAAGIVLAAAGWWQGILSPQQISLQLPPGGAAAPPAAIASGQPASGGTLPAPITPTTTTATMRVEPSKKAGAGYVLEAEVKAKDGAPLNEIRVRFYDVVELLGTREMLLGTETTDGLGRATMNYLPTEGGTHTVIARYVARSAPGEARTTFAATVVAPSTYEPEELPLADFSRQLPAAGGIALLAVWSLFAFALFGAVRGIATAPRLTVTRKHREE